MSAVPAAIDALVAAFKAALEPQVQVEDGPPVDDVSGDLLAVGLTPTDPAETFSSEDVAGLAVVQESFIVFCLARTWTGNTEIKPQRDRTYQIVTAARDVLRADSTLGGAVVQARFAGSTYQPWRSERGYLVVDVPFRVAVTALSAC